MRKISLIALLLIFLAPLYAWQLFKFTVPATAAASLPVLQSAELICVKDRPRVLLAWKDEPGQISYPQRMFDDESFRTLSARVYGNSFVDYSINRTGTYAYRIRTLDNSGEIVYSNIIFLEVQHRCEKLSPEPPPAAPPPPPVMLPPPPPAVISPPHALPPPPPTVTPPPPNSQPVSPPPAAPPPPPPPINPSPVVVPPTPPVIAPPPPAANPPPQPIITPPPPVNVPPPTVIPPPPPPPPLSPIPSPLTPILWGAATGWRVSDGENFESLVGSKLPNRAIFVHWGNENSFPSDIGATLKPFGSTLTIFWEAMDYTAHLTNQPKYSYSSILNGDHDNYIKNFAASAKAYGGPVILIPFSEMNGNWNPSGITVNGNSPQLHIAAWRHVRQLFKDVPNVKFGWAVNSGSVPNIAGNQLEDFYPGDAYVDIVGIDGFNFAQPWMTFDQIFASPLQRLKKYNKPIYLFSMASCHGPQKADWIRDAFEVQVPKHPEIKGWIWFNENKECDWRVNSDAESLKAFQEAIK